MLSVRSKTSRTPTFHRLWVEPLEDRQLPSTLGSVLSTPLEMAAPAISTVVQANTQIAANAPVMDGISLVPMQSLPISATSVYLNAPTGNLVTSFIGTFSGRSLGFEISKLATTVNVNASSLSIALNAATISWQFTADISHMQTAPAIAVKTANEFNFTATPKSEVRFENETSFILKVSTGTSVSESASEAGARSTSSAHIQVGPTAEQKAIVNSTANNTTAQAAVSNATGVNASATSGVTPGTTNVPGAAPANVRSVFGFADSFFGQTGGFGPFNPSAFSSLPIAGFLREGAENLLIPFAPIAAGQSGSAGVFSLPLDSSAGTGDYFGPGEFLPESSGLLTDAPLVDLASMENALQHFLNELDELRQNLTGWLTTVGPMPWLIMGLAVASALHVVVRRTRQQPSVGSWPRDVIGMN